MTTDFTPGCHRNSLYTNSLLYADNRDNEILTCKNRKLASRLHEKIIRLREIKNRLRDLMNREDNINSLFA